MHICNNAYSWTPPTNLGKFHQWSLDREEIMDGYHGALVDSRMMVETYNGKLRAAAENYEEPTKKQKNKYVARSLYQKYKDVQYKARAKAKANCGISREPYGKNCGRCIGHGYPVSIIKWNKPGSDYNGRLCEVCNWAFNSKREGGDRRRCGHQVML